MLRKIKNFLPETLVFLFAFLTRFWRLDFPPSHYFDEVYHVFTAQQMFRGNPAAWEWWNPNPTGFAYEWTHPPLAKEFMWLAVSIFGDNPMAWRFFSAFFGFGSILLIYLITLKLFKNRIVALLSSLVASLDGLLLTTSRIGMNDSYFLFFTLLAFFLFLNKKFLFMSIALGLAISSKWTALYGIGIIGVLFLFKNSGKLNLFKTLGILIFPLPFVFRGLETFKFWLVFLIAIPGLIYLLSYTPFFLNNHVPPNTSYSKVQSFVELQRQMWWYHTNLKATHPYQSTPGDWVFNLRPVWLFIDYEQSLRSDGLQQNSIASIYTLSNPLFAWGGLVSILYLCFRFVKRKTLGVGIVLLSYFGFFLPWMSSPRIMFNYHYLASSAFLAIALGFTLNELMNSKNGKIYLFIFLLLLISLFIYFYPVWTGIHIPKDFYEQHFWLKTWK